MNVLFPGIVYRIGSWSERPSVGEVREVRAGFGMSPDETFEVLVYTGMVSAGPPGIVCDEEWADLSLRV